MLRVGRVRAGRPSGDGGDAPRRRAAGGRGRGGRAGGGGRGRRDGGGCPPATGAGAASRWGAGPARGAAIPPPLETPVTPTRAGSPHAAGPVSATITRRR